MKITSKKTIESKLPEFKGVKFTLNKMTEARRIQLSLDQSGPMEEYRKCQADIEDAARDSQGKEWKEWFLSIDTQVRTKLINLFKRQELIQDTQVNPSWVKVGLKSIENLETEDGVPVTPETFIDEAPPELYAEVLAAIHDEAGLNTEQTKN